MYRVGSGSWQEMNNAKREKKFEGAREDALFLRGVYDFLNNPIFSKYKIVGRGESEIQTWKGYSESIKETENC